MPKPRTSSIRHIRERNPSPVTLAIGKRLSPIAKRFGIRPSAVQKWRDDGYLPQSELSGLTNYSEVIADLSDGRYSAADLREATRAAWVNKQSVRKRVAR